MKAWRLAGVGGALTWQDVPEPAVRSGGVVVRIAGSPLLSYLKSFVAGDLPSYSPPGGVFTPGTSGVGVVEEVGAGVIDLRVGQRVFLSPYLVADERVAEPASTLIGLHGDGRLNDFWPDGTLAERALVPASAVTPIPEHNTLDAVRLCCLSRCLVPYGGLLKGRLQAGETIVVHGATGAFGYAGVLVALAMGAAEVVAAGRNPVALDRLSELPRVRTVAMTGDIDTDVRGLGRPDMALDMIGRATTSDGTVAVLTALRRGGRLVLMGSMSVPLPIDYSMLIRNGKEVLGAYMYPPEAPAALLALAATGQLDLNLIETATFPLPELVPAMDRAAGHDAPLVVMTPA